MSEDTKFILQLFSAIGAFLIAVYLVIGITVAYAQIIDKANWCEYKDGKAWSEESNETGKRFEYNPLTAGLTGECINPGDKGL